jgi:hypothetical protein
MVPQDMYNNMLNTNATDFSKNILDSTLANPRLDSSSKNALYNQRLIGYLKQKRRDEERPIKVALDDGQLALLHEKPIKQPKRTRKQIPKAPTLTIPKPIKIEPTIKTQPQIIKSPKLSIQSPNVSYRPLLPSISEEEDVDETEESFRTVEENDPLGSVFYRLAKKPENDYLIDEAIREVSKDPEIGIPLIKRHLISVIKKNHWEFNVTENGKIVGDDAKVIQNSNFKSSLDYIESGRLSTRGNPGTNILVNKLLANQKTKKLFEKLTQLNSPARAKQGPSKRLNVQAWIKK